MGLQQAWYSPGAGRRERSRRSDLVLRRCRLLREATPGRSRGGKGLPQGEQPLGGRGSDTEPKCRVDPNNGCASDDERHQIAHHTTSDPRDEPGALAAHAGICAGGRGEILVPTATLGAPPKHISFPLAPTSTKCRAWTAILSEPWGAGMKRREFIGLIGG